MTPLSRAVLETIVYYDVMDFPLTAFEVWKYLILIDETEVREKILLDEVLTVLETEEVKRRIGVSHGLYFVRGREELIGKRLSRQRRSIRYTKRIRRLVRFLRYVPFVRMVGSVGSVALKNARRGSDWDLFIVLESGHIWTGRLLVTAALQIIGKRRFGKHVRERACLNYWVTTDSLEVSMKDLFSSHEYMALVPLYGRDEYFRFREHNAWIRKFRPQYQEIAQEESLWCLEDTGVSRLVRRVGEMVFGFSVLERALATIQKAKIERNPKTHWPGSFIVANDRMLVFLPRPRGPRVFEKFKRRLGEMEAMVGGAD